MRFSNHELCRIPLNGLQAGSTALHFAIDGNKPTIAAHLLTNGHDVTPRDYVTGYVPVVCMNSRTQY
jgi:hypothetical protein